MAASASQRRLCNYANASGLGAQYKARLMRGYAEGRRVGKASGSATLNPEDGDGTELEKAWDDGFTNQANASYKFDCEG